MQKPCYVITSLVSLASQRSGIVVRVGSQPAKCSRFESKPWGWISFCCYYWFSILMTVEDFLSVDNEFNIWGSPGVSGNNGTWGWNYWDQGNKRENKAGTRKQKLSFWYSVMEQGTTKSKRYTFREQGNTRQILLGTGEHGPTTAKPFPAGRP